MKSNWTAWLLVAAAVLLLITGKRVDLVAFVAPLSILVSWLLTRKQRNSAA